MPKPAINLSPDAGKYDDVLEEACRLAQAEQALLFVLEGKLGDGFSVRARLGTLLNLPNILRGLADEIEKQTPTEQS